MYWRNWDYRYIQDRYGNTFITFGPEYLDFLKSIGASDYDILVAETHIANCGRVICEYMENDDLGFYEPIDDEFWLEELYDQVDLLD